MSIPLEDFDVPEHPDFQRANGAPMVMNKEGKRVRLSRPSNYAKPLDDESALTNWRIDTACLGVAHDSALQARYVAVKRDDRSALKTLREKAIQAGRGEQAADIGTALHAMSERWEKEPNYDPPSPYKESLQAYEDELKRLGLFSEMFEYQVVNLDYGSAGTVDRLYRLKMPLITPDGEILPEGTLVVGDLKTGKSLQYSLASYSVQMALYAQGEFYDVITDSYRPTPEVNQRWGILMWMPSDQAHCEALWIDLEAGNYGAWLASEVKDWRKRWRSGDLAAPPIPNPSGLSVADATEALADMTEEVLDEATADAEWVPAMAEWIQQRVIDIRNHPKARQQLMYDWPEGVPTPKQGIESKEHVLAIVAVLDKVESDHSLSFPVGDPRIQLGVHKDALNTKEKK